MNGKILSVVLIVILFLIVLNVPNIYVDHFGSPDEAGNSFFIKNYAKTGNFYYEDSLNEVLNGTVHPRSAIYQNGKVSLMGFNSFIFINGFFEVWLNDFYKFSVFLYSFLLFIFLFLIFKAFDCSEKQSLVISALTSLNFVILFWFSRTMVNNVLTFLFLVIGFYYLVVYDKVDRTFYLFLSSFFFSFSFLVRNEQIVFVLFGFLVYFFIKGISNLSFRKILAFFVPFLFSIFTILALNYVSFGNPFSLGYLSVEETTTAGISAAESSLLNLVYKKATFVLLPSGFEVSRFFSNFFDYSILILMPLSFLFVLFLVVKINKPRLIFKVSPMTAFLIAFLGYQAVYYLAGIYYGMGSLEIGASYMRYTLGWALLVIAGSYYFILNRFSKRMSVILIFVLLLMSLSNTSVIYSNYYQSSNYGGALDGFKEVIPQGSMVLSHYYEKLLFPSYKVITFGDTSVYNNTDSQFHASLLQKSYSEGYQTYLVKDRDYFSAEEINAFLEGSDLSLIRVSGYSGGIYKVVGKNETIT